MTIRAELIEDSGYERADAMVIFYNTLSAHLEDEMPCETIIHDTDIDNSYDVEVDFAGNDWEDQTPEMLDVWENIQDKLQEDFGFEAEFYVVK